jgi:hypothetical protein
VLRDSRGLATIPAIFVTAFLIGAAYYLFGLGDAIVYHETMRDAADATAFAPSVIHARGMNVLAFVNLVMSAILAILVAVKIVQLLLLAANVIACAIPFNPWCPVLSSWQPPVEKFVRVTEKTVSTVNRVLNKAEGAIAKTMPIVGQAKASAVQSAYGPIVESSFVASPSLVPSGPRFGLPVEDEAYENLCLHAAEDVAEIVWKPLKFLPGSNVIVKPILTYVGDLVGQLAKTFPGWFCGGGGAGFSSLGSAFKDIAKKGAASVASEICREATRSNPAGATACSNGIKSTIGSVASGSSIGGPSETSKRVYRPATIGSDYYATFSFVTSHYLEKNDVDARLDVISAGRVPAVGSLGDLDRLMAQIQLAKSELYYEPKEGSTPAWGSLRDEALLNMRWRARLRKWRPPAAEARGLLTGGGLQGILRSIPAQRTGVSPAFVITIVLGHDPAELAGWAQHRTGTNVGGVTGGILH